MRVIALALTLVLSTVALAQDESNVQITDRGLHITTPDKNHVFDAHLMAQVDGTVVDDDRVDKTDFHLDLKRARLLFRWQDSVHGLSFLFQPELAGVPHMLDARLDWKASSHVELGAGQMIVPMTRAWNTALPLVVTGERSALNRSIAPGRRLGATARFTGEDRIVDSWLGVFEGTLPTAGADPANPMLLARVETHPLGAMSENELAGLSGDAEIRMALGAALLVEPQIRDALPASLTPSCPTRSWWVCGVRPSTRATPPRS